MQTCTSNTWRKQSVQTFNSNIQCKHSIRTFTANIQFEYFTQTCNLAIFSANIIPSMFTPCPVANILGLLKSERRGKPIAFSLLLECFVRVVLTILRFLQLFKAKFENVYRCMLFALSRFSICALEFINLFHLYARGLEDMAQKNRSRI